MIPTSIPPLMHNRCRIDARKSDAKNIGNHTKTISKGSPTASNYRLQIDVETLCDKRRPPWLARVRAEPFLSSRGTTNQEDSFGGNLPKLEKPNKLKEKTCWQGTTSQSKHALGAFGPGADLMPTANVPLRALGGRGSKEWGNFWSGT